MAKFEKNIPVNSFPDSNELFGEIKLLIEKARVEVAVTVNSSLTGLNWNIGRLINHHILQGGRAEYGKEILATLSPKLTAVYGQGFNASSLNRMLKVYRAFHDENILATVSQELSWSHFIELITLGRGRNKSSSVLHKVTSNRFVKDKITKSNRNRTL